MSASPALRLARAQDEAFLLTMLFHAAHAHEEPGARPEQLLETPALARYVVGFTPVREVANRVGTLSETMLLVLPSGTSSPPQSGHAG